MHKIANFNAHFYSVINQNEIQHIYKSQKKFMIDSIVNSIAFSYSMYKIKDYVRKSSPFFTLFFCEI